MQTLVAQASRVLGWEQVDLPNGVYRVQNVRWVSEIPNLRDWVDCSDNAQWSEELDLALQMIGEERLGTWIGMGQTINNVCHGLAWMLN